MALYALCVWPANFKHAIDGIDLPYISSSWRLPRAAAKVCKLWLEHLGFADKDALREVLTGFRICEGYRSLEELKERIVLRARTVEVATTLLTNSDFRLDQLARALKKRGLNLFSG